jgi:ubiquinone/menaquinone biosynthesis C-methylase UbiE
MAGGSVSFDRAATFYDRTRMTDASQLAADIELLQTTIGPGAALEVGVGTGALAVPLAERGRRVIGVDVAGSMLAELREKDPLHLVRLAIADATALPFGDGAFAGAYCRWVLHLIPSWHAAVRELLRVIDHGGTLIVEPGGYSGEWQVVHERFVAELGPAAEPVGLRVSERYADLDASVVDAGGALREVIEIPGMIDTSLERFFAEAAARSYSWTWRVAQDDLDRAVTTLRAWAVERYGPDLSAPFATEVRHRWRVYERT